MSIIYYMTAGVINIIYDTYIPFEFLYVGIRIHIYFVNLYTVNKPSRRVD